jgi:response regulator RpfG family c-di-GMP phosphodiesterase
LIHVQGGGLRFRVMVAHTGLEVLEKARRLKPSAIILNPLLPLLSGQDVLTILTSDPETANIPVILLGSATQDHAGFHLRLEQPLTLPLNPAELQHILDQLLQPPPQPLKISTSLLTFVRLVDLELPSTLTRSPMSHLSAVLTQALQTLMQSHRCQILEVDDLEQAELLARIWKPQMLLVETLSGLDPRQFLDLVQQSESLCRLSLVSFQPTLSTIAPQMPEIPIYSYNASESPQSELEHVNDVVQLLRRVLYHHANSPTV